MWSLGQLRLENDTIMAGGLNKTREYELYDNMKIWAENGGAVLSFIEPYFSKEQGGIR
jgi:hypothetical protein